MAAALVSPSFAAVPEGLAAAMSARGVAESDFSCSVWPLDGGGAVFSHRPDEPRSLGSVMKVFTTAAALEILGPGKTWRTDFLMPSAPDSAGRVPSLYIRAAGAPWTPASDMRSALRAVRAAGVSAIRGNIIVDRSVFNEPPVDPGAFDDKGHRPYNIGHDALGLSSRAVMLTFLPVPGSKSAAVVPDPPLAGFSVPQRIRVARGAAECPRALTSVLRPEMTDAGIKFSGFLPASCGQSLWSFVPWSGPDGGRKFEEAVLRRGWKDAGGKWSGRLASGPVPAKAVTVFTIESKPLIDLLREINKFSINPMARNLFLSLSSGEAGGATLEASRRVMDAWLGASGIDAKGFFIENGSGLSRTSCASASQVTGVLVHAARSPWAAEFISSLPISGVDGTMRRRPLENGTAHVKTGYIKGARSVAGYVRTRSGKTLAVSAVVNGEKALGARPVLDAFLDAVSMIE